MLNSPTTQWDNGSFAPSPWSGVEVEAYSYGEDDEYSRADPAEDDRAAPRRVSPAQATSSPSRRHEKKKKKAAEQQPALPANAALGGGFTGQASIEGRRSATALPNTSLRSSWYSPAQRRAGQGTQRRNTITSRSVVWPLTSTEVSHGVRSRSPLVRRGVRAGIDALQQNKGKANRPSGSRAAPVPPLCSVELAPVNGANSAEIARDFARRPGRTSRTRSASFADQFFAVVERSVRQLWHRKIDVLLEISVPLIFIAVSLLLWAILGNEQVAEQDQYTRVLTNTSDGFSNVFAPPTLSLTLCYTSSDPAFALPNLPMCDGGLSCDPEDETSCVYYCDGDYNQLPVPGLRICRRPPYSWNTIYYLSTWPYYASLSRVPTIDSLLLLQWAALSAIEVAKPLVVSTMSGLAPNTRYSAILCSGNVYFVDSGSSGGAVANLIATLNMTESLFRFVSDGHVYSSVEAARAASNSNASNRLWAIVELRQMDALGLDLVLHMNNSALPSFGTTYDDAYSGGVPFDTAELYAVSGFLTLHQAVCDYYINTFLDTPYAETHFIASFATPKYDRRTLLITARDVLPLIYALAFLYSVTQQVKRTVLEKELRIREAMLIMGLKQWTLYLSDFLIQLFIFVVTCVLSVVMLKLTYVTKSDPMVLFLCFFMFSLTTIPLSGIIAAFFSKARLSSLMAPVIYFILVIPMFAMANASGAVVTGFSVFSPSGFAALMGTFLKHETGNGCSGKDLPSNHDNPTMAVLLGMLAADFAVYYVLMLYLDAVVPKEWGTPRHPLFFVLEPLRWCCGTKPARLEGGADGRAENGVFETTEYADDVVSFDGLRKEYSRAGKTFVAVNNLYWGMREDEISVLLGHNGAGKTTLLNMMTGMVEPDEGDCYIYGHSVRTQKSRVRQLLGFCPQHNILWDELTCRDHLEFYGKIKGLKGWELENAICRMLHETDLLDKMDVASKRLSGGMKRKLSIAVAFVGGSQLVFLDEPTAGLDVGARRHVWELLKRMAQSRTLLLTTHYMDEADLLGSRIGIMSQGRLKCSGSSLFLKSRLGVGYSIVISVDPESDPTTVDELVMTAVPGATVLGHNGCELSYQLPMESVDAFPALLNEIDSVEAEGVRGYALSATTLEEVFLKVSEEDLDYRGQGLEEGNVELIWNCETSTSVLWMQFAAMMRKRFWSALRDRRMQCFQIVCPVLCILIAMLLSLVQYRDPQSITYDFNMFGKEPTSVFLTANCDTMLGRPPLTQQPVILNETHLASAVDVSYYALDTWYVHNESRYGAFSCHDAAVKENLTVLSNAENWPPYQLIDPGTAVNVMLYNASSYHQAGLNQVFFYDLMAKQLSGSPSRYMNTSVVLFKRPPASTPLSFVFIGALIMIPFTFLPSNPVAWVVKERQCGSRHLQNLCGLNFFVYWGATFLFDMCAYLIVMLLCILIFAVFQRKEFTGSDRIGATFALFIVYGLTSTSFGYCLSFLFKEHATAQTVTMGVSFVAGFLLLMIVYVLSLDAENVDTADKMRWGFRVVPSYCIGEGIINLLQLQGYMDVGLANSVWDMDQLGWSLVYMAAEFPAFWILTLMLDHPWVSLFLQRLRYHRDAAPTIPSDEDSDVEDEREAVYEAESDAEDSSDVVRVLNLQKRYSTGNMAVKGITFSIFPGEVFGLLGTNGAGKTTTISMLCQQFLPTGGSAYVCGYDVVTQRAEALRCIGYCPQFDATLDLLTVEEQLRLYASIRGVVAGEQARLVEALCTLCELTQYRRTVTGELSGGNRRKLSVAMSLVGGPQVLFLDEPSAGMDPVARRGMWTAIQRASAHCSVVLTTHHLEEVEALADIVAIMVRGYIRCIGDKVHLKNKFGSAFEVSARLSNARHAEGFLAFMKDEFPDAQMSESDGRRFVFQLPRDRGFGDIFEVFQSNKRQLHITDYSVSQTSIEQILLQVEKRANSRVERENNARGAG